MGKTWITTWNHFSRYKEAYKEETLQFIDSLINDKPAPCTGEDGLIALIMAISAGKSAIEGRWVKFSEMPVVICDETGQKCKVVDSLETIEALKAGTGILEGDWTEKAMKPVINAQPTPVANKIPNLFKNIWKL